MSSTHKKERSRCELWMETWKSKQIQRRIKNRVPHMHDDLYLISEIFLSFTFLSFLCPRMLRSFEIIEKTVSYAYSCALLQKLRKARNFVGVFDAWWNENSANWRQQKRSLKMMWHKISSAQSVIFSLLGTGWVASARFVCLKNKNSFCLFRFQGSFFFNSNPHVQKTARVSLTARANYLITDLISDVFSVEITQQANRTESLISGSWDVEISECLT